MKEKIIKAFSNFEDFDIPTAIFRALDSLFTGQDIWWQEDEDTDVLRDYIRTKLYEMDNRAFMVFYYDLSGDHDEDGNSGFVYYLVGAILEEKLLNLGFYND